MDFKDYSMIESHSYYTLAEQILEEPEIKFIFAGVSEYISELLENEKFNLNSEDINELYQIFLNRSNEFYFEYLHDLENFNALGELEKVKIIYSFLKKESFPNWFYDETDFSYGNEEDEIENKEPYDVSKIDIVSSTFQAEYMLKKYKLKELFLSPDYQRKFVWTSKQKSRLIESILIKIPLPIFYIDARNDDKWVVIDGLQRFTTIFEYLKDGFRLSSMEYLTNLNGKKFSTLERKYQRRIEDLQLLCNFIRPNTPADIAFNIFQRINTLGTKLEIQEIRNAMFRGKSTDLLIELSKSKEFINIVTEKRMVSFSKRMEDHATILRYLAFKITNYKYYENNNMNKFLSNAMEKMNEMNEAELISLKNDFINCMKKADILFNMEAFLKPTKKEKNTNYISKSLFESIGYTLDKYSIEDIKKHKEELLFNIYEIYEDTEFILKTSVATNNPPNVHYRFEKFQQIFKKIIGY